MGDLPKSPEVIFIDGVDGAGKSTLATALMASLEPDLDARLAPVLGEFLPCGNNSDTFREWVSCTPVDLVVDTLLNGFDKRMRWVGAENHSGVWIVDRGPLTVSAGCAARLALFRGFEVSRALEEVVERTGRLRKWKNYDNQSAEIVLHDTDFNELAIRNRGCSREYEKYLRFMHHCFSKMKLNNGQCIIDLKAPRRQILAQSIRYISL